ncbi:hypothetical protein [Dokdonella soli]|uniref:hypothetical protein n=1 Tax=Dokdonella soli TaxID=529810 RepID=UPI0031E2B0AD
MNYLSSLTGSPADGGPQRDSFAQFLARHTTTQQDAMLGKGRAELYRIGTITFADLIGQREQTLTLAELRAANH